jgi:pyruvate carboxylase
MEVWGGATFDASMRFLREDPWARLSQIRKAVPNILLQMLIRGMNGVGYSAYPDNLIEKFVAKSWETGVDIFRIFDSLNWMENIAPCIEAVRKQTGGIAEGALCYTGDILDPARTKYTLDYYVRLAKDLENAGAHILCIKDMSGLLKPLAARELIPALKDAVKLPIHLHTHDTSSLQPATYLAAIEAGVDVVDCAIESLSGLTSQPNFNAIVEMMRFHERENPYDVGALNKLSGYFETIRSYYTPFESGLKSSSAEVFQHEIPGGQYSNLKPQAVALGLGDKFEAIKTMYADVNLLFGDLVKVTPSSKIVGDMAQYLVANDLTTEDVLTKGDSISFPESVQQFFMGEIGFPEGGFPEAVQRAVIKDKTPLTARAGTSLPAIDFTQKLQELREKWGDDITETDLLSYLFYPKVFEDFLAFRKAYGDVSVLASPLFFYGMKPGSDTTVEIAPGKTLLIRLQSIGPVDAQGHRTAFFRLNGQSRAIDATDRSVKVTKQENRKVDGGNPAQIGAPLQGLLSKILVAPGEAVKKNQALFVVEAMKMETTVTAGADGVIKQLILANGTLVNTGDLVLELA